MIERKYNLATTVALILLVVSSLATAQDQRPFDHLDSGACATPASFTGDTPQIQHATADIENSIPYEIYQPVVYRSSTPNPLIHHTAPPVSFDDTILRPGLNTRSFEIGLADFADRELDTSSDQNTEPALLPPSESTKFSHSIDVQTTDLVLQNNMLQPLTEEEMATPKKHVPDVDAEVNVAEAEPQMQANNRVQADPVSASPIDTANSPQTIAASPMAESSYTRAENVANTADTMNEVAARQTTGASGVTFNFSDGPDSSVSAQVFAMPPATTEYAPQTVADQPEPTSDTIGTSRLPDLNEFEISKQPSSSLIIHPPMVQPYNRNQHTFVIENRGENSAKDVMVEISVPEYAKIIATLPINSVHSPNTAVFKFEEVPAGDQVQIHLTAVSRQKDPIGFTANLVTRSTYEFGQQPKTLTGELDSVSYNRRSDESPADAETGNGSVLVSNPYFQSGHHPQSYQARRPTGQDSHW